MFRWYQGFISRRICTEVFTAIISPSCLAKVSSLPERLHYLLNRSYLQRVPYLISHRGCCLNVERTVGNTRVFGSQSVEHGEKGGGRWEEVKREASGFCIKISMRVA